MEEFVRATAAANISLAIHFQHIKNAFCILLVSALEPCTTTIRFTLLLRKVPIGLLKGK